METMERRSFLKLTLGLAAVAAGTAAVVKPSQAMPVMAPVEPARQDTEAKPEVNPDAKPEPAVATQNDIDAVKPENVQYWRWRRRWRWRRWRRY